MNDPQLRDATEQLQELFNDASQQKAESDDAELNAWHSGRVAAYAEALQIIHDPFLGEDADE